MAICIVQDDPFEIVFMERVNLFESTDGRCIRLDPKLTTFMCSEYFKRHEHIFKNVRVTVVENQMQRSMLAVQYSMETLFHRYGSAITIHPSTIKAYFGTSKKNYAENKRAAIDCCRRILTGVNLRRFEDYAETQTKADDVADAILLAIYAAQTHSDGLFRPPRIENSDKQKRTKKRKRK